MGENAMRIELEQALRDRDVLEAERDELKTHLARLERESAFLRDSAGAFPPGHFYSPIPSTDDVKRELARLASATDEGTRADILGVDLNEALQRTVLSELAPYLEDIRFPETPTQQWRYHLSNGAFGLLDASILSAMLRKHEPKRVVEVGCGFSSAAMLDTSDRHLDSWPSFTFIDPYMDVLKTLMFNSDSARVEIIEAPVQEVQQSVFQSLEPGDFLLVDSTHVSKFGSDVNHLIFRVFPLLPTGTIVHVHDIPFPFEYPKKWLLAGRFWNEAYLIRAFLQYNEAFRIRLFNAFIQRFAEEDLSLVIPEHPRNPGGSLWLEKIV